MTKKKKTTMHQHGAGQYEECFVAFLDILGFRNFVQKSETDTVTLQKIIKAMKVVGGIGKHNTKQSSQDGVDRLIDVRSRFFSDTLAFFLKQSPNDVAQLFFVIRYLQDQLWKEGFCLRGSIVLGSMYWCDDASITIGQGLIDAYKNESTIAIYPRITVSHKLFDYITNHSCEPTPFSANREIDLGQLIRKDADGVQFLDLLNPEVTRVQGEKMVSSKGRFSIRYNVGGPSTHSQVCQHIDRLIEEHNKSTDERVSQKYAWLKSYRNITDP